eukprot:8526710-Ditylum_brightwellii.AAC.1
MKSVELGNLMISKKLFYVKGIDDSKAFKDFTFGTIGMFIATFKVFSYIYFMDEFCCAYRFQTHSYNIVLLPGAGLPQVMTDY